MYCNKALFKSCFIFLIIFKIKGLDLLDQKVDNAGGMGNGDAGNENAAQNSSLDQNDDIEEGATLSRNNTNAALNANNNNNTNANGTNTNNSNQNASAATSKQKKTFFANKKVKNTLIILI